MNIGSLNSAASLRSTQATSQRTNQANAATSGVEGSETSSRVSLSKGTELAQELTELQRSDPSMFKEVMGRIAQRFDELAANNAGSEGTGLSRMASSFAQAAKSGEISALQIAQERPLGSPSLTRAADAEGGQSARALDAYRRNAPPPPAQAIDNALSSALSIVASATGSATASAAGTGAT